MQKKKVIVVGAGASGLVAAIKAAARGHQVCILEKMNKPGKKILATGNGKCNLTNLFLDETCYRSDNKTLINTVKKRITPLDVMAFFQTLGVYLKDKEGYIYPYSEQASTILNSLLYRLQALNVPIFLETKVLSIKNNNGSFCIKTSGQNYEADAVILAAGGQAYEKLGSDGSGFLMSAELGHTVVPPVPALTALRSDNKSCKLWSGVRVRGSIELRIDGIMKDRQVGELQLTDYGISGVPTFQVSRYAGRALHEGKKVTAVLDFMPELEAAELAELLTETFKSCSYKNFDQVMEGLFNWKLCQALFLTIHPGKNRQGNELSVKQISKIVNLIKHYELKITKTNGFDQAQVTSGGVSTKEVHPQTMESKLVKGLYLTGEVLDVDGTCGGYNLQWAFATGMIAGESLS